MVKISIIIPIYNGEKYLRQCLDSIIGQTFEDFEILCINDGSKDSTQDILEEYAGRDSRVRLFSQDHNGIGSARNTGLDNAKGDYIYFTDCDDYLEKDTLKTVYSISSERDLDLLIFKLVNFTDDGERDYSYSDMSFLESFGDEVFTFEDIKEHILEIDVTVYTKFYKRQLIEDVHFEEGVIFEDNLFFNEYIFKAKRISFYNECLYNRRIREDSVISSASRNYSDIIEIFNMIDERFRQFGYYPEFKEKLFMRKIDAVNYRFDLIRPEFREYFFTKIKEDYSSKKSEYERELDFDKIDLRSKTIYRSVLSSDSAREFEIHLKASTLENRLNHLKDENDKLKKENRSLKSVNRCILNSRSWKITKPLRKLKNLK